MNIEQFIEQNIELVDNNNFTELYDRCIDDDRGKLTEVLYECGIDPLRYMTKVPDRFAYRSGINSITIPNGIMSIGYQSFGGCTKLTSVTIPNSVTSIGGYAFSHCSSLRNITIPDGVTSIDWCAFDECAGLKSIAIPDSVTHIGRWAFDGCKALTNALIGNGVTSIGEGAFRTCTGLTGVTIGNGVKHISRRAFYGCSGLTGVYITDLSKWCDIEFDESDANPLHEARNLYLNGNLVTDVNIPNGVTEIKKYAFHSCGSLTNMTLPNSVTKIDYRAFYDCSELTSITIPDGVTRIVEKAFEKCLKLTTINYIGSKSEWNSACDTGSSWYSWDEGTGNYTVHCIDGIIQKSR